MVRIKQALQEWRVLVGAMITALFGANDALDLLADSKLDRWLFLISFAVFVFIVMWRLASLHSRLDEYEAKVRLIASPGSISWNHPDPGSGKVRLETHIYWEIWTVIDIHTAQIGLNIVGIRYRKWWQIFRRREKRLMSLWPKGWTLPSQYRRTLRANDSQPFEENAKFEYEGPLDWSDKEGLFGLELVLVTGSPAGTYRAYVDPRLWERGSSRPL